MIENLKDVIIRPGLVVHMYNKEEDNHWIIAFNEIGGVLVGSYGHRNVRCEHGENLWKFLINDCLPVSDLIWVMDFNKPTFEEATIYEKHQMTKGEIEERLGLAPGTLHIKEK